MRVVIFRPQDIWKLRSPDVMFSVAAVIGTVVPTLSALDGPLPVPAGQ
jgi:hypothetical protein